MVIYVCIAPGPELNWFIMHINSLLDKEIVKEIAKDNCEYQICNHEKYLSAKVVT
jgi:hypothetical protein